MPAQNLSDLQFDALATAARPTLLRYARHHASRDHAQDCVQSALCYAWERRDRWTTVPTPASFRTWLIRILDHHCRQYLRRTAARGEHVLSTLTVHAISDYLQPTSDLTDLDYADWSALVSSLDQAIDHTPLTPRQRTCIECWLAGWTQRQIATHLGISQATVSHHILAAEHALRTWAESEIPPHAHSFFNACSHHTTYTAPTTTGAALARIKLEALR